MKKLLILGIVLLAACKPTETTNTTTTSVSETSATVATVAPATDTTATLTTVPTSTTATTATTATAPPAATGAIETMGTNPAARPATQKAPASTATTATHAAPAPSAAAPAPVPTPAPTPAPVTPPPATKTEAPKASSASLAADGAAIFKSKGCVACHGATANGDTAMGKKNNIPDFHSAAVKSQSDAELTTLISNGKGPISASAHKSKNLSPEQIKAVIAWIRSL